MTFILRVDRLIQRTISSILGLITNFGDIFAFTAGESFWDDDAMI